MSALSRMAKGFFLPENFYGFPDNKKVFYNLKNLVILCNSLKNRYYVGLIDREK